MRTERYDEALAEAERVAQQNPDDLRAQALLATARAAAAAPAGSVEPAVEAALRAVAVSSRGQAARAVADEVTGSQAFQGNRFVAASRVMLALVDGWQPTADDADARIGAAAVLSLAAYGGDHRGPMEAVGPLVEVAVNLLEIATRDLFFPEDQTHQAWVCFRSAGALADASYRAGAPHISSVTAELAIRIAEANEQRLAVPIACDLSSPRERLREVLRRRHDADSMARLSATMERAEGCVLGTYAP